MRMHAFGAAAALCNMLASVDLKGYAARLPLLATEVSRAGGGLPSRLAARSLARSLAR
jgi:hypothetical protein